MIRLDVVYPDYVDPATADYPYGVPRNDTVPGAFDGLPREQRLTKDLIAMAHAILDRAGVVPSGTPDNAVTSQIFDAFHDVIGLNQDDLESNGGTIREVATRYLPGIRAGLAQYSPNVDEWEVTKGGILSFDENHTLELLSNIVKDPTSTWALGTAAGGLAAGVSTVGGVWCRVFIVSRPSDDLADICFDTSVSAANFFSDANAIAAGFTDSDRYKRIGWVKIDSVLGLERNSASVANPNRYRLAAPVNGWDLGADWPQGASSVTRDLSSIVPPSVLVSLSLRGNFTDSLTGGFHILPMEATAAAPGNLYERYHLRSSGTSEDETIYGNFWVNADTELRCWTVENSVDEEVATIHGWHDDLTYL